MTEQATTRLQHLVSTGGIGVYDADDLFSDIAVLLKDVSDHKAAVDDAHAILTQLGIPLANGVDPACLGHRMRVLVAKIDVITERTHNALSMALAFHDRYCDRVGAADGWAVAVHRALREAVGK